MKKSNNFRIYAWIEFFIWLLIVAISVFCIRYHYDQKQKQFKSYQIFMNDVDGLIVGSPVRFLGIQIGHVTKIQLVSSDVYSDIYVKFIVTEKNLTLPSGSLATVEGSGLGGSKSLEIYPPKDNENDKIIAVKDSTRLNKVLGLFKTMFKDIEEICTNFSHTGKELSKVPHNEIEKNVVTPTDANKSLTELNTRLDNYIQEEKNFRKKFLTPKKKNKEIKNEPEQSENNK